MLCFILSFQTNQYSKLEKADILEMTVKHLRQLQRQQVTQALSCDPTVVTKYKTGFNECANEVMRYLGSVQGVDGDVRGRLMNHLSGLVTQVNTQTQDLNQQPLNVQIPQQQVNQHGQMVQNGCLLMPAGVHTSPIVLQPVQNCSGNVPKVYTPQVQQRLSHGSPTQFSGSFQIVSNASSPNAVAVPLYLGQSHAGQEQNIQPSPINMQAGSHFSRSPPRTKASLKAFDSSAFEHVSSSEHSSSTNSSPSCSPISHDTSSFTSHMEYTLNGLAVRCGRTSSPLKVDDVWRPW